MSSLFFSLPFYFKVRFHRSPPLYKRAGAAFKTPEFMSHSQLQADNFQPSKSSLSLTLMLSSWTPVNPDLSETLKKIKGSSQEQYELVKIGVPMKKTSLQNLREEPTNMLHQGNLLTLLDERFKNKWNLQSLLTSFRSSFPLHFKIMISSLLFHSQINSTYFSFSCIPDP